MIFETDEDREELLAELISGNRYNDVAHFLLVSDVTTEDIFELAYMANKNFYINTFECCFHLLVEAARNGTYVKMAGNFLQSLYLDEYYPRITRNLYRNKNAIIGIFLRDILLHLVGRGYNSELSFTLSLLADNEHVDVEAFKQMLGSDLAFKNAFIAEDLLISNILNVRDILDIIAMRYEYTTYEDIDDLLRYLYRNEDNMLEMINVLLEKYSFVETKRSTVKVVPKCRGKEGKFYDHVRRFITDIIVPEVEFDVADFLYRTENSFQTSKELTLLNITSKLRSFIISKDRAMTMVDMFNIHGQEDFKNLLTYDEIVDINNTIQFTLYIYELEDLTAFKFFVRLFNINRFNFLSYDRAIGEIRTMMKSRYDDLGLGILQAAINKDIYNLVFNY